MNKTVNFRIFPLQNYYVIFIFSCQKTCYKTYFYVICAICYKSAVYVFCGMLFSISKRFESYVKKCTQTMLLHDLGALRSICLVSYFIDLDSAS